MSCSWMTVTAMTATISINWYVENFLVALNRALALTKSKAFDLRILESPEDIIPDNSLIAVI